MPLLPIGTAGTTRTIGTKFFRKEVEMLYNDLRGWMDKVDEFGELKRVEGVDWKYEMGAVTEVYARNPPYSAILFDKIKDYPAGHRVLRSEERRVGKE